MRLQLPHRWAFPISEFILVKPNRMFGLVEASAWMHVRNGAFKMKELIGLESDSVASFFASFLFW